MARFLPESVREGLAHEFERLEQTEGMLLILSQRSASRDFQRMRESFRSVLEQRQRRKEAVARFSQKQRVEGSQSWHIAGLRDIRAVELASFQLEGVAHDSFDTVTRSWITTIGWEYNARFTQLSRHAPYPITEEMRVKRFVRGLREYIFRSVRQKEKGGSGRDSRKKQRVEGSQSWHIAGLRDIRAVELASFQLEGVAYDSFDTVTRGRSVGSPPLAWGEFSRLFMARFLPESVREGLAHEFERLEQTEGMSVSEYNARFTQLSRHAPYPITEEMRVKRFVRGLRDLSSGRRRKRGSGRDSRKKQRVEGSQSWHIAGLRDIRAVELASFQLEGVAYYSFDTVTRGRSVGSPPLAWGEFSRLFMARFLPESVREGHAPYPITEEMRVKRFVRGLREYIFRSVVRSNSSTFAEVLSLALQLEQRQKEKGGSGRDSRKKQRVEGSQSWHIAGLRDIRAVELASFQLAGVAHDSFDTVTRGRSVGSPPLAWVPEYNARFTQLSRHAPYPITEEMRSSITARAAQKEKGGSGRDSRKKQMVEGSQSWHIAGSVGSPPLAWGEFSRLFMARFLPESVREGLAHEFERLEQTEGMSVSEYNARFTQLSRHAPYPITEEMRVKRFVRGLRDLSSEEGERRQWPRFSQKQMGEGSQSWHIAGLRDIRAVELASFQLEGVAYDSFDTVTHGRSVGSPPLAWGEFSRLFMARFLPESVREGLAHEFERLEQTEGMSVSEYNTRFTQLSRHAPYPIIEEMRVKRFVRGLREYILDLCLSSGRRRKEAVARDSRKKQRVEGSQSWHIAGLRDIRAVELASFQLEGVAHDSFDTVTRSWITTIGLGHAPYPITEEMRVKRFVRGLREYIFRSVLEQRQKEKGGSGRDSRKKQRVEGSQSWHIAGLRDIRAVELASFQLEGVAYDSFDTVTRGRSVGSPPLAWGEFSRLFMARFLPESVREGLAHEFERLEQTEACSLSYHRGDARKRFVRGLREYIFRSVVRNCSTFAEVLSLALQLEQRQKEKGGSGRDSRKNRWLRDRRLAYHRVEGYQGRGVGIFSVRGLSSGRRRKEAVAEILARNRGLRDRRVGIRRVEGYQGRGLASFQLEGVAYDSFDTVTRGRSVGSPPLAGGVAYDSFDTVTHGRSVGSPPLAWGEFSRLFRARFLPESVREGLAHEFERLEQTEEMRVKRFFRGLREYIFRSVVRPNSSTFAEVLSLALQLEQRQKEKEAVAEILARNIGLRDRRVGISQVGSPPLAWGEFSRLFMARFLRRVSEKGMLLILSQEEMRVKRFVRGLREYIFRSVVRSNCSTFAVVLSLALQLEQRQKEKGGSGRDSRKKQRVEGSQSWHIAGLRDIRAVELASFQLEGVAYDSFDTVTRGRSVGSPPLGWGEFSRLFMARFLPESVREGLAHEFERLEQTEGMSVSEYNSRFTQLSRHAPYPITEEMRVKRFVRGLREYIFRSVVRSNSSTFAEVLSLALQLEQRQKEKGGSGRDSRNKQRVGISQG
ncbi:Retrotransposon gag domain [Sesbania bispinosa]|nr:Retrotransposon gag domain [Sesbania bispinosa]